MPRQVEIKDAGKFSPGKMTTKILEDRAACVPPKMSPLEVLLKAMDSHVETQSWNVAAQFAKDAAPYCHPKIQNIELTGKDGEPIAFIDRDAMDRAV